MVIELRVVQFWSEIILVISNRTHAARSFDFRPNCTPLSSITIINYFRPSFHGVPFFFFFLSFDKGQWANAGKRLFKWGKLLSLRWYVQRKSPNFTYVGMVTMVRSRSLHVFPPWSLQPICWGKGTGNGDCIYSLHWLSFSHRYWPRNQKSTLKTDKWQTKINP